MPERQGWGGASIADSGRSSPSDVLLHRDVLAGGCLEDRRSRVRTGRERMSPRRERRDR